MRKLLSLVFLFSIAMLFALAVTPAFAKPGSIKVDSDSDCDSKDKEDNEITDDTATIWLNTGGRDVDPGTVCITLINQSTGTETEVHVGPLGDEEIPWTRCLDGPPWYYSHEITLDGQDPGVITAIMSGNNNCYGEGPFVNIGNDTFTYLPD